MIEKPYFVELRLNVVVMAESEQKAIIAAESCSREAVSDAGCMTADTAIEVTSLLLLSELDDSWDGMAIPYNGDGNTRLNELLPAEEPVIDTKTVDMFN